MGTSDAHGYSNDEDDDEQDEDGYGEAGGDGLDEEEEEDLEDDEDEEDDEEEDPNLEDDEDEDVSESDQEGEGLDGEQRRQRALVLAKKGQIDLGSLLPPASKRTVRKAKLSAECIAECEALIDLIQFNVNDICERHQCAPFHVRRRIGFGFEASRKRSDWIRFQRWTAATSKKTRLGADYILAHHIDLTLAELNGVLADKWHDIKADDKTLKATMRKVKRWEKQELDHVDGRTARIAMNRFAKLANALVAKAELDEGIAAIVIAAHPHSMANTVCAASENTNKLFNLAATRAEGTEHIRANFQRYIFRHWPSSTMALGPNNKAKEPEWEKMKFDAFKRKLAPMLIRWVDKALAAHAVDPRKANWHRSKAAKLSMTYVGFFDILRGVKLCVSGWPSQCKSLLGDDAVVAPDKDGSDTARVMAGSLKNVNVWPKKDAPLMWAALNRKTVRIVPWPRGVSAKNLLGSTT
ncbi:hypothetical protein V8E36_003502 [Tilletia maclaganii]